MNLQSEIEPDASTMARDDAIIKVVTGFSGTAIYYYKSDNSESNGIGICENGRGESRCW